MIFLFVVHTLSGQEINLYEEFNGRYDFTIIGNTLNKTNNLGSGNSPCEIFTEASANLTLNNTDQIVKAYLYWAGSGAGDLDISLNNVAISADLHYNVTQTTSLGTFVLFGAFKDVTQLVQNMGNGNYNVTEFDLTNVIEPYCPNAINFGGWAMVVIYKNETFKLTQLNVYHGMHSIGNNVPISIDLEGLHVIDKIGSKIGFIAWEGDANISNGEVLKLNNQDLFENPLNPINNAFNGTNSITGSNTLYNMDIDVYNIENYINNGDTSANIQMNSAQDFVMISTIITKLNSQLPDATIKITDVKKYCDSRQIDVSYQVYNLNSTDIFPSGAPISIYANDEYIEYDEIVSPIPIGGSEEKFITLFIPSHIPDQFTLKIVVDEDHEGVGIVLENNENNNVDFIAVELPKSPSIINFDAIHSCNKGNNQAIFDVISNIEREISSELRVIGVFETLEDANANHNPIINTNNYISYQNLTTLFVRIENNTCFSISTIELIQKKCMPKVYNLVTPNNDGDNDYLIIDGLWNIFQNFELEIYNRWGTLVWKGNHQTNHFTGQANKGIEISGTQLPTGTYYYFLNLNDPDFPQIINGYLQLTR